jgi:hypothetical protein
MTETTFQTVRLGRGKHWSPEHGVCVMELASMIAAEPFSDRPACVCPVIAAVLRAYNDTVRAEARQDLYGCASEAVGTRASEAVQRARLDYCLRVVEELAPERRRSLRWRLLTHSPARIREVRGRAERGPHHLDHFGWVVARYLHGGGRRGHARLLRLVGELASVGTMPATRPVPVAAPERHHNPLNREGARPLPTQWC